MTLGAVALIAMYWRRKLDWLREARAMRFRRRRRMSFQDVLDSEGIKAMLMQHGARQPVAAPSSRPEGRMRRRSSECEQVSLQTSRLAYKDSIRRINPALRGPGGDGASNSPLQMPRRSSMDANPTMFHQNREWKMGDV